MSADLDQKIHLLLFIGRKQSIAQEQGGNYGASGVTIVLSTEQDQEIYAALEQKGLVHPAGFSIDREQQLETVRCRLTNKGLGLYQRMEDSYRQWGEKFRTELE